MDKFIKKLKRHVRLMVQVGFSLATNGNLRGFYQGTIYRGNGKMICVPGLNCYSCPGALGACPLGSLQGMLAAPKVRFPYYVLGLIVLFGALLGRFVCGWLCPFGLVQDLAHKIPFFKKIKKLPGDRALKYLKYFFLAVFVVALPLAARGAVGVGTPWFCKYVCPSGTLLAGIPLVSTNAALAQAAGPLFWWKISLLALFLLLSLLVWRPFCRYVCPLGALYGLFNPVAALRYKVDKDRCTTCGACSGACKMGLTPYKQPNSMECVRCGACINVCPKDAIHTTLKRRCKNSDPEDGEKAVHAAI